MAHQTSNGHKRLRKMFGKIHEIAEMPNLIEVQKQSYDQFLMVKEPEGGRTDEGLQAVFRSVFPIRDFGERDRGKTHSSGKLLFAARIIPYRGSWLDFEFDAKDIVYVRIDRRRKLPVTTLLYALGLDDEEILSTFYDRIVLKSTKEGWRMPFRPDRLRGIKPTSDLVDAQTGKVAIEAGRKVTARLAKKLADEGLKELLVSDEDLYGRYLAQDIVNMETGEIYGEAGEELDAKVLATLKDLGLKEIPILDIDHVNIGAFIRNTLHIDKNSNPEEALLDIYRV